jgi:hypothetical protein
LKTSKAQERLDTNDEPTARTGCDILRHLLSRIGKRIVSERLPNT